MARDGQGGRPAPRPGGAGAGEIAALVTGLHAAIAAASASADAKYDAILEVRAAEVELLRPRPIRSRVRKIIGAIPGTLGDAPVVVEAAEQLVRAVGDIIS